MPLRSCRRVLLALPRICGLLPWGCVHERLALAYQVSLILLVLQALVAALAQAHSQPVSAGLCLQIGSLLSLVMSLWCRRQLRACDNMLTNHMAEEGLPDTPPASLAEPVAVWLVATGLHVHNVVADGAVSLADLHFPLSSFILLSMTVYFRSMSHTLLRSIDHYCCKMFKEIDWEEAEQNWNLVQAFIYLTCGATERCFLLTQVTATVALVALAGTVDWMRPECFLQHALDLAPAALVALEVNKALLHVAAVTDKCERVPSLCAFLPTGYTLDVNRNHLVQHIVSSQTGFYVLGVCINSAVVSKLVYVTCVLTFAINTRSSH